MDTIKSYVSKVRDFIDNSIYSLTKFIIGDDQVDITLDNTIDFS
jgi:hypothetical protein